MQRRPTMLVANVDVGDARLQQPRQRLRVVGVGRQPDLPLDDAGLQVRPETELKTCKYVYWMCPKFINSLSHLVNIVFMLI